MIKILAVLLCILMTLSYQSLINTENLIKKLSIIYAHPASLIKQIDGCKNSLEKSFLIKVDKHIP